MAFINTLAHRYLGISTYTDVQPEALAKEVVKFINDFMALQRNEEGSDISLEGPRGMDIIRLEKWTQSVP